ncbi:LacI family DNA-binding transcriptional regulator [Acidovorax sp. RAC01]|uniref:LacI family DNA-binding transcriptional regulator n=1 Tax=Acidovorax sp. RAC01 TaxID=1842533 RepID=UPI00083E8AD7|nr:LacI family DNA-binding transcriptional regulator [Acidovorax sp. RAC01]
MKQATIKDVAAKAGVSTATVSRVISAPDQVRVETRERVWQCIDALRYQPDASARALVSGRSRIVGTLIPTYDNASFARQTQSLQKTLAESGYQLLVTAHEHDPETELRQAQALQQRGVDALVLVGAVHSPSLWKFLRSWNKPSILTWTCDDRLPSIGIDNAGAASEVGDYLVSLGHRRIGVIAGMSRHNERAMDRVKGLRHALRRVGLTLPAERVTQQPFGFQGGMTGLRKLMSARHPPTAVFCGNDLLAAGAFFESARLGLRVPEDLSIVGFDDMELAGALHPGLTTVHVPVDELGHLAGQGILALLSGAPLPMRTMVHHSLVIRGSTGICAPAA